MKYVPYVPLRMERLFHTFLRLLVDTLDGAFRGVVGASIARIVREVSEEFMAEAKGGDSKMAEARATRLFRMTNFELFAKPTPFHRRLATIGTIAFVLLMGNMLYEKRKLQESAVAREQ